MNTWADWGEPIMLGILIFWGLFVVSAVLSAFSNRDQRKSLKDFFERVTDPHDHHHSQRG